jgi:pyruvate dehydrogenase E2 component (dihydrolipoamide acetyltransferase)
MATEIKLPPPGEGVENVDVIDVKVTPGTEVSAGQALLEIEVEKGTVEVPAPEAGRVTQVLVKKGDRIQVGQPIALLEANGKAAEAQAPPAAKPASKPEAPARDGSAKVEPTPVPKQAAPAQHEAPRAPEARPDAPEQAKTKPSDGDAKSEEKRGPKTEPSSSPTHHPPPATHHAPAPAGPATRRLARELGVDLGALTGSGPHGRITEEDIKAYVHQLTSTGPAMAGPGVQAPPLPDFAQWGPIERQALDSIRRHTAQRMSLSWSLVPHVTHHDQADITELDAFRRRQEGRGPKLTVTAFVLKIAAVALKQFPAFNSSLDGASGQLILKRYYHLGVAVDTDRGLLVPVLRDVDRKSVTQLAEELAGVAERARQRKLPAEEMRGGTFTITNLGGIGGTAFTPIINYPEVAILGLARARLEPTVRDGQIVPRLMLPLSLSYDHRVIDGAAAARFTRFIADMLENPWALVLHS